MNTNNYKILPLAPITIIDPNAARTGQRFYRLRSP